MKKNLFLVLMLAAASLLAGCGAMTQVAPSVEAPPQPLLPNPEKESAMPTDTPLSTATPEPAPGGYPSAAFAAQAALAELLGVAVEQVEIRNIEPVEWPDGCLGLAGPDEMCTMAIVPGYRVVLSSGSAQYIFRTNESGSALRRETGLVDFSPAETGEEARPFATWKNPDCSQEANVLLEGLSFGACGGPYIVSPWQNGMIPAAMLEFLDRYAAFEADTPAGMLVFNGVGQTSAAPAEQRAIAEWMKIQFMAAQSGRAEAAWGLAFSYNRQGGIAGFCDEVTIYLDGSVNVSSCKDVNIDLRLDAAQLEQVYAWYDRLQAIDYSYSDPATADGLSIKLASPSQGQRTADDVVLNDILTFCAELITQARGE